MKIDNDNISNCSFWRYAFCAGTANTQIAATQVNLTITSAILAGLRLEQDVIYSLVRRDIRQESVIYRSIQEETEASAKRSIALDFLRGGLSVEAVARGIGLLIEEVHQLQQQLNGSAQS